MRRRPTVSPELLRLAVRYAASIGIDARAALEAQGLDLSRCGTDDRVAAGAFEAFVASLAAASGDPCFGLHLGASSWRFPANHLVLALAGNSATVGEALRRLLRFHALLADALAPAMEHRGGVAVVRLGAAGGSPGPDLADAVVATLAGLVRRLSDVPRIVEVRLRRSPPALPGEHERLLGARVRFGSPCDEIHLDAAGLSAPVFLADEELLGVLERHASRRLAALDGPGWRGRVSRALEASLAGSGRLPSLEETARSLATSRRSLQARLRGEGATFRRVADGVRRALAEDHLADTDLTLAEVAFLVGFGDQSAFTTAFRRWTGLTPKTFRARRSARPPRS